MKSNNDGNVKIFNKIIRLYKASMPFLMFLLTLLTVIIGWNQYTLSKKQKLYETKRMYLGRYLDSAKEVSNDIADIARISRDLLRKCLLVKNELNYKKDIQKKDLVLSDDIKSSLSKFYRKWDDINSKISANQHNLPFYLIDKYQKFTYSVAFSRKVHKDPWNNNYELHLTNLDSGEKITVNTDDRMVLPYGECFSFGQKLNDVNDFNQEFHTKSEFLGFLDNCIELGTYTFDIHEDVLIEAANYLVEISLE